ncbi:MAG: 50S ribosomal protein L22 ['Conium maculatum' witches'-broom phytoplasma]|uniref:Large ribosomal subunit protein uL22 n=4 Tax=16SrIII (X-disease group) TaxID=85623 RepID=A0A851HHT1_9MOLU|nr:50S ribosomal protein L22 [Candidatus Phytoplasma pruni]AGN95046.1 L22 ribosomal protein ['Allium sativum' phytoplasma]AGQ18496.1 L22 ribosomal protein ['Cucurbita maxima var. zapallito' phytoplasma]AGQ18498.1 L22 ribosomal protein ['Solanum lycopersicum' phytoplasma]MEC4559170.1 50S ribosomal protein L22 ['Conium maculatum' witches'-broom phytoplasma]AGQ18490.1 L22 ribosomal protein ['Allium sativum' phytoplasma]
MNVKAIANQMSVAPRKTRLVADLIRGKHVREAQAILMFTPKAASPIVSKLLKSAVANAVHNFSLKEEELYVKEIFVNEGLRLTRLLPRAKGKTDKIKKRTSHITIVVSSKTVEEKKTVKKQSVIQQIEEKEIVENGSKE